MSYNPFIKIDQDKIDKLPWIQQGWQYYFADSNKSIGVGIVYDVSRETYGKLNERLRGSGNDTIKPKDKVYLLPGSKIPLFKLKDHLRKIGATHVGDINKATFFIGNNNIAFEVEHAQAKMTNIIFTDRSPEIVTDNYSCESHFTTRYSTEARSSVEGYINSGDRYSQIYLAYPTCRGGIDWVESRFVQYVVTPVAAMIIYNSISKKIPIVSEDVILDQMSPSTIIDQEVYESIVSMFQSTDRTNHEIGIEIMANCDIKKSIFYLWRLNKGWSYKINNSRMKNIRLFVERSAWKDLYGMDAEDFIEYMYTNDYLTKEFYQELIKTVAENYKDKLESPVFKITLAPSEKYKEYSDETDVFEFTHKDEQTTTRNIENYA